MVSSLKKQQIKKRKQRSAVQVRKSSFPGKKFSEKINSYKLKRKIRRWLSDNRRKISIYASGCLFLLLTGLLLSSSVPTFGTVENTGGISLPADKEIEEYLFKYLKSPDERVETDVTVPQISVLSSIEPATYTVKRGDTLSEISQNNGVSLGTLISFNNIQDVRKIKIGCTLRIPNSDGVLYTVRNGDNLSVIAERHGVELNTILDANNLDTSVIKIGQELYIPGAEISAYELKKATGQLFVYPVIGRLTSPFGMRNDPFTGVQRMHYGIDIGNSVGTPIKASMDGSVVAVGFSARTYGNYIILKHSNGFQTLYGHLSKTYVVNGSHVQQNETIGTMGNTGRSTGPHLHFSIYKYQNPVDPLTYLF